MDEDYDIEEFEGYILTLLETMWRYPDELEIGRDISDVPEIKIIFDGYGDLETEDDYIEGGNKNMESYAIFVHRDSWKEDFEFPEHTLTPWALVHRPKEEVCIYAWYDVEQDTWEILPLEDRLDGCEMTIDDVMHSLRTVHKRYFAYGSDYEQSE